LKLLASQLCWLHQGRQLDPTCHPTRFADLNSCAHINSGIHLHIQEGSDTKLYQSTQTKRNWNTNHPHMYTRASSKCQAHRRCGNAVLCGQLTRVGAWSPRLDSCAEEQNCVEDADPHRGHRLLRALDQDEHAPRLWRFPPWTRRHPRSRSCHLGSSRVAATQKTQDDRIEISDDDESMRVITFAELEPWANDCRHRSLRRCRARNLGGGLFTKQKLYRMCMYICVVSRGSCVYVYSVHTHRNLYTWGIDLHQPQHSQQFKRYVWLCIELQR